jgi:hypothetical protein
MGYAVTRKDHAVSTLKKVWAIFVRGSLAKRLKNGEDKQQAGHHQAIPKGFHAFKFFATERLEAHFKTLVFMAHNPWPPAQRRLKTANPTGSPRPGKP